MEEGEEIELSFRGGGEEEVVIRVEEQEGKVIEIEIPLTGTVL